MARTYESFPVIYCMENPGQPGLVKIGYTTDLWKRLNQLNAGTAVAYPFEVRFVYEVSKDKCDVLMHQLLDLLNPGLRVRTMYFGIERVREFFRMSAEQAYHIFDLIAQMTDTEDRLHLTDATGSYLDSRQDWSDIVFDFSEDFFDDNLEEIVV